MSIQYKHLHLNHQRSVPLLSSYTIALDMPSKDWLLKITKKKFEDLGNLSVSINLEVGFSKCSIKDKYVRSIGRELSVNNIKEREFTLSDLHLEEEVLFLTFKNLDKELPINCLVLKIHKNGNKVHFINAIENFHIRK